jgi:3-hydroxyacyl-CoA dehydrogenase
VPRETLLLGAINTNAATDPFQIGKERTLMSVSTIGVKIGAGIMGSGIAQVAASRGLNVLPGRRQRQNGRERHRGRQRTALALADMIGLDVLLSVMQILHDEFADSKYRPCPLLKELVAAGQLGRKSGRGVYSY